MYVHECARKLSRVQLFATPWTVAHQALLSVEFSRQKYWSGLPSPSPRDLPDPGVKPTTPVSPALAGRFLTTELPTKPIHLPSDSAIPLLPRSEKKRVHTYTLRNLPETNEYLMYTRKLV